MWTGKEGINQIVFSISINWIFFSKVPFNWNFLQPIINSFLTKIFSKLTKTCQIKFLMLFYGLFSLLWGGIYWYGCKDPFGFYLFKVNNWNTREMCELRSKLTRKTPERRHWRHSSVFIVNLEQVCHIFLPFQLLTLNKYVPAGKTFIEYVLTITTILNHMNLISTVTDRLIGRFDLIYLCKFIIFYTFWIVFEPWKNTTIDLWYVDDSQW